MPEKNLNRFETLAAINCSDKIEKKGKLSYLSWAWAWDQFKRMFPDSYFTVYETPNGCIYWTDGKTCWVKTGVTLVDGDYSLELIERLPVMDNRNESIPLERVTSRAVNDSIQRSLTKAVARHGLGLYVYAGEDLPEGEDAKPAPMDESKLPNVKAAPVRMASTNADKGDVCAICGKAIQPTTGKDGQIVPAAEIARTTLMKTGKVQCAECFASWRRVQRQAGVDV